MAWIKNYTIIILRESNLRGGKMIIATKTNINILREWGKPSNMNHSHKLDIISFYFILGKSERIKVRIKPGHLISNIGGSANMGLIEYYQYLKGFNAQKKEEEAVKGIDPDASSVIIFQLMQQNSKETGKPVFYCHQMETVTMKNMHAFLEDIYTATFNPGQHIPDESNVRDFNELFKFKKNSDYDTQQLVIVTECVPKADSNCNTFTSWHLIGPDNSIATEHYMVAKEFGILPYPPMLGEVEKIVI